mmetsp:Transcript_20883/g.25326  ORF Transcript_20883/g.25326 Transcript_20883/m.25326 type:complete len:136 (+) Transcript_20883:89-496(+)
MSTVVSGPGLVRLSCKDNICSKDTPRMPAAEVDSMVKSLELWQLSDDRQKIVRTFTGKNFKAAMDFLNNAAAIAEEEGHHPDMHLTNYRQVKVEIYTQAIGSLSLADFILAAKLDEIDVDYSPKWLKQNPAARKS